MLVLICSPRPDPLTGTLLPSASPIAGQPGLGLWMTVLLVSGCVCVCVWASVCVRHVCQPAQFGTSWVLEICWHCSLWADLLLSGFPGGPLLICLTRKLYKTGQTTTQSCFVLTRKKKYVYAFTVCSLMNERNWQVIHTHTTPGKRLLFD